MPRLNANADDWAATRVGIFFPAHNSTPADGNLTGQCVTLLKWFFAEMTDVPNPFSARGDARYVGQRLVAQGLAREVPYSQRQRGDVITNEYGLYGHIYLQLSGGRVFEENANVPPIARKAVDGAYVYASRIGRDNEAFRRDIHVYRINSYNEQGSGQMIVQNTDAFYNRCNRTHWLIRGRELDRATFARFVGQDFLTFVEICSDDPEADKVQGWQEWGKLAVQDNWRQQILDLQKTVADLGSRPSKEELQAVKDQIAGFQKQVDDAHASEKAANEKSAALEADHIAAQEAGNAFTRWIGEQINKILGKK